MMWYMVHGADIAGSLDPPACGAPGASGTFGSKLQDQGRLLLAGPLPAVECNDPGPAGFSGSLIVAEFDSLEMARAWADADPTSPPGCMPVSRSKPFRKLRCVPLPS